METDERKPVMSRLVNDRVYQVLLSFAAGDGDFLCECERSSCAEEVSMTLPEYVRLRDRDELVFASGHDGHHAKAS